MPSAHRAHRTGLKQLWGWRAPCHDPGPMAGVLASSYVRREPEQTLLYRCVQENLTTFLQETRDSGHALPRFVEDEFTAFLECGVLAHGFARVRCPACR